MDLDQLVMRFESLGDSCEFGLVQRQAGAEPLGLLRFAGFTVPAEQRLEVLIAALDRGFEGLGDPDTIEITAEGPPDHRELIVRERAYGLLYHTFLNPTDVDVAKLRQLESIRLRYLRRKLLADLASAEKIFVWKCNADIDVDGARRLLAALRRHGPVTLLWVCADPAFGAVGTVEHIEIGLLRGVIDRFAPYHAIADINHAGWFAVCAAALALAGSSDAQPAGSRTIIVSALRDLVRRAVDDPSLGGMRGVATLLPADTYTWSTPELRDDTFLDPNRQDELYAYDAATLQAHDDVLKVVLERALVASQGAVITQDGHLLRESCWEFLDGGLVPYGMERGADGTFRIVAAPARTVPEPALLLKRPWWLSYRHFLIDAASLLAFAATRLDLTRFRLVIGLTHDVKARQAILDLLTMLAPGATVLEQPDNEIWRFADLHYITPVHVPPLCKVPAALAALRTRAYEAIGSHVADPPRPRLLMLPEPGEQPYLDNHAEIVALCAEFGFVLIAPEQLSMADRIALFRDANSVLGVRSPQFANIAFCRPGTPVIALAPGDWPDPFYAELAGQSGLSYVEIFGPPLSRDAGPSQNPFRIEPEALRRVLTKVFASDAPRAAPVMQPVVSPQSEEIIFERFLPVVAYPEHRGDIYLSVLAELHRRLRPRTYVEIGTQQGQALALARCIAVAVDPHLPLQESVLRGKPELHLFRMTGDTFFSRHDLMRTLGGAVSLAFLDGPMLHYDRILRDFIHLERCSSQHTMVVIHDVVPLDVYMACRDRLDDFRRFRTKRLDWWTGDVWKIIVVLEKYRPDLVIDVLDAAPTGIALVQNLSPDSTTLSDQFDQIVREVAAWPDEAAAFAAYRAQLRLRPTADLDTILAERERRRQHAP